MQVSLARTQRSMPLTRCSRIRTKGKPLSSF
jgi:hypothetical protein